MKPSGGSSAILSKSACGGIPLLGLESRSRAASGRRPYEGSPSPAGGGWDLSRASRCSPPGTGSPFVFERGACPPIGGLRGSPVRRTAGRFVAVGLLPGGAGRRPWPAVGRLRAAPLQGEGGPSRRADRAGLASLPLHKYRRLAFATVERVADLRLLASTHPLMHQRIAALVVAMRFLGESLSARFALARGKPRGPPQGLRTRTLGLRR